MNALDKSGDFEPSAIAKLSEGYCPYTEGCVGAEVRSYAAPDGTESNWLFCYATDMNIRTDGDYVYVLPEETRERLGWIEK